MALVVEDGTGKSDAESYVSEADTDTYATNHSIAAANWSGATTAVKEAALRYATRYIEGKFKFVGVVVEADQALRWPRYSATDREGRLEASNVVPQRVKDACSQLATHHVDTAINEVTSREEKSIKLDVLAIEYIENASLEQDFPFVRRMLRDLLEGSFHQVSIWRG